MAADDLRSAAFVSKAWPYEEARKLLKRYPDGPPEGRPIVFETGYGPSGLPHLGTFQEVARTLMVRHALSEITDWPSRLIEFSDDMDGMRGPFVAERPVPAVLRSAANAALSHSTWLFACSGLWPLASGPLIDFASRLFACLSRNAAAVTWVIPQRVPNRYSFSPPGPRGAWEAQC